MSNLCGHRGFAGPSACILKQGHEGDHSYGNYLEAVVREDRKEKESLRQQLADSQEQVTLLRGLVEQSRGSVKFDLNRYEQLLTIKRMVGVEKTAQYIAIEIEANRLSKTLDGIDEALAATEQKEKEK